MTTLLEQLNAFISQENKKNEVDELAENIGILFKKFLLRKKSSFYLFTTIFLFFGLVTSSFSNRKGSL
jgi:hypothetical protein